MSVCLVSGAGRQGLVRDHILPVQKFAAGKRVVQTHINRSHLNWGCKWTTGDQKHPGSDHSLCLMTWNRLQMRHHLHSLLRHNWQYLSFWNTFFGVYQSKWRVDGSLHKKLCPDCEVSISANADVSDSEWSGHNITGLDLITGSNGTQWLHLQTLNQENLGSNLTQQFRILGLLVLAALPASWMITSVGDTCSQITFVCVNYNIAEYFPQDACPWQQLEKFQQLICLSMMLCPNVAAITTSTADQLT